MTVVNGDEKVDLENTQLYSGHQCMGLEAALAWETCTFGMTKKLLCLDSSFTKITIELHCNLWKLSYNLSTKIVSSVYDR